MSIQGESFRLLALTESESLKNEFSQWVVNLKEVDKTLSASPSDEIQEENKITEESSKKAENKGIHVRYQGQDIQVSTVCLDERWGNLDSVDGIILGFNETEEGVERLQGIMKALPPGFKQNTLILFKQSDGGVKLDMTHDDRNLFRFQDTQKTVGDLLERMITIVQEKRRTEKHQIKKGLIEKPKMPVWKKEQYLKSFQKKREFSQKLFYFNYSYLPTKENFVILNESLRKSKFLSHVDIDFSETHIFLGDMKPEGDKIFKKFGESFRELSKLKVLKFKSLSDIGNKKLELLSENWKHFSSLETLHIQYHFSKFKRYLLLNSNNKFYRESQAFTTPGEILNDCIKRLHSLKHIYLSFTRFHPDVIDLTDLACSLKRFPRLQGVHLDLRCLADAEPNQEAWKKFGNALKKITSLKTLKFRIMMAQQTETIRWSVHYLCEALRELNSLREISLDFNGTSINDEMIINLSDALERHVSLQKIIIILPNCQLTNEGLIRLNQAFARLSHLNSIFLNLNFCYEIDDRYLNNLGDSLGTLPCLENLKLWIIWCRKISEEALENFDQRMKSIKSLKDIVVRT